MLLPPNLYWADNGTSLYSVPTAGGGSVSTLTSQLQAPGQVATDGTNVFAWEGGANEIVQVAPSGGSVTQVTSTGATAFYKGYAIANGKVYVAASADASGNTMNGLVSVVGTNGTGAATFASGLDFPSALAGDATDMYFFQGINASLKLYKLSQATPGGTPQLFSDTSAQAASGPLLFQGDSVYLKYGSTLAAIPKATGVIAPVTITGGKLGNNYAVDAQNMYFVSFADKSLYKAPLTGGATTLLCSNVEDTSGGATESVSLLVDDTSVYVGNMLSSGAVGTRILKIPK